METKIDHRCGAVLGTSVLIIAALRFATTMIGAAPSTTLLVFALSAMAGELFNPFFFSPLALYPVFLFSLLSRFSGAKILANINVVYVVYMMMIVGHKISGKSCRRVSIVLKKLYKIRHYSIFFVI